MENYRRMAAVLGTDAEKMVLSYQTHTTNVRKVTEEDAGKGIVKERDYRDVDGLITDIPGITLVTFYADCVPLYFVDPVHRAVGLSHSGWRGTVHRMGKATLEAMNREYGTEPADVIACIGPSICQDCFEVGPEVAAEFADGFAEQYHNDLFYQKPDGKYQVDLWRANQIVLRGGRNPGKSDPYNGYLYPVQSGTPVFSPDHGNGAREIWQPFWLSESRDKIILDKKSFAQHLYTLREALFCDPIKIYWMV